MRKMRAWIKKYERSFMLGLVIVLLVIFTVTSDIVDAVKPVDADQADPRDIAGTFSVLPGEIVEITYEELDHARNQYGLFADFQSGGRVNRPGDAEVWAYLIQLHAAKREGITVGNSEVNDFLKAAIPGFLYDDPAQYKEWVRNRFRIGVRFFEETVRDILTADRVRDLHRQAYTVAPAATREELVKEYADQGIEYARISWAALDASAYADDAAKELAAAEDPDKLLEGFFQKDPSVKLESIQFQHPRRFAFEILYSIHRAITEEAYERMEALFSRAYPKLRVSKLEPTVRAMEEFYGIYRERLLKEAGSSWDEVRRGVDEEEGAKRRKEKGEDAGDANAGDQEEGEGDKEDTDDAEDEEKEGDEKEGDEKEGDEKEGDDDEINLQDLDDETRTRLMEARRRAGFQLCKEQVGRELRVRGMFQWFHERVREDEKKSIKVLFDHLKQHDDPNNPVCATEPDKGCLIVYREFPEGLTADEIENLEDCGVKFTHNLRMRVMQIGDTDLPKVHAKADVLGEMGHGRQIMRLLDVKRKRRKIFSELTEGEKQDLKDKFYLPQAAREKAKAALAGLRTRGEAGELETDALFQEAKSLRCRVYRDEWIEASFEGMAEPERLLYWPAAYVHMKDRYFLHRELANVLRPDKTARKLGPGSWLRVLVDSRLDDERDLGTAYLVLLLERREPGPDTMPPDEFDHFLNMARERRRAEERERWANGYPQLWADFEVEFRGEMKKRMEDETARRAKRNTRR